MIADEARGLLDGYATGMVPPQFEGGIGADGVRAIDDFVRDGGTLVCFNRGSLFAIDQFHLPVKNVVAGVKRQEFFTGGSMLEVEADADQPVMAGMPERAAIFVDGSPAFETARGLQGRGPGDVSGHRLAAALRVPARREAPERQRRRTRRRLGKGHVVLLGFRPQWRGQPFGTFRVIFNAVLNAR